MTVTCQLFQQAPREAPPQTAKLPADLVFPSSDADFEQATAGTRGHDRPTAAARCAEVRSTMRPAMPLQSGWSGHCLQGCGAGAPDATPPRNSGQVSKSPEPRIPSAAATCVSAWVSTPPVMARASTMVNAISLLRLKGWHAPAGRRTCETPASSPGQADQTGTAGGCQKNWDPAGRSFRRTTRTASAESEVRPGPRLPTLRPYHLKTGEAGPEAPIHILPAESVLALSCRYHCRV